MQNYTIEYRTPKKGETYLFDEAGRVKTTVACEDHRIPQNVLVPVAPAWPDKPVIVIEKGKRAGKTLTKEIIAVREVETGDYLDEYGNAWIKNADTITKWHEYGPITERREYTADDLDNLPEGTCAWDENGSVWQRSVASWFVAGGDAAVRNPLREDVRQHLYSAPKH